MSSLSTLWSAATIKPFLAQDNNGNVFLVQAQVNNGWFLASLMVANSFGYAINPTQTILSGSDSIWSTL